MLCSRNSTHRIWPAPATTSTTDIAAQPAGADVDQKVCRVRLLSRTKARAIRYLWPLLADDQDPDGLAARVAFHLHRLKISNAALAQTGLLPPAMAHDLSQGRLQIAPVDVATLAHALHRSENDFGRHLEPRENAEWHFYRISARNRLDVWHRARNLWQSHHMTQRAAAAIMHCHPSHISHALQDHPNQARRILALPPAERLTAHLNAQDASIYFLTGLSTRR